MLHVLPSEEEPNTQHVAKRAKRYAVMTQTIGRAALGSMAATSWLIVLILDAMDSDQELCEVRDGVWERTT